jgi:Zn finger protein HypA/HybF involved in hydrogenase expression
MYIKRLRCRTCGAPKVKPPSTAYVYCDYCGALTDWDFHIANATAGSAQPAPEYEARCLYLKPQLEEARVRGDRGRYAAVERQLFDTHVRACKASYSPRVGDPAYRGAIIEYQVATRVVVDFDPQLLYLEQATEKAEGTMRWTESGGQRLARSDRLWNLFGAFRAHRAAALSTFERAGVLRAHPDGAPGELLLRMELSAFVQRWLPALAPADAHRLLFETGLQGDYDDRPAPAAVLRHCGSCGVDLGVAPGARRVLCEGCGFLVDVGAPEIACEHCGGTISAPAGATMLACPYCRSHVTVVGGAPGGW